MQPVTVGYVNIETVSQIKEKLIKKSGNQVVDLILFCNNKQMKDEDFLWKFGIELGSEVKFCYLMKYLNYVANDAHLIFIAEKTK